MYISRTLGFPTQIHDLAYLQAAKAIAGSAGFSLVCSEPVAAAGYRAPPSAIPRYRLGHWLGDEAGGRVPRCVVSEQAEMAPVSELLTA
jgi:hypothetical protein